MIRGNELDLSDPSDDEVATIEAVDAATASGTQATVATDANGVFTLTEYLVNRPYVTTATVAGIPRVLTASDGTTDFGTWELLLEPRPFVRNDALVPVNTRRRVTRVESGAPVLNSEYGFATGFTLSVTPEDFYSWPWAESYDVLVNFDTGASGDTGWDFVETVDPDGTATATFDYPAPTWPGTADYTVTVQVLRDGSYQVLHGSAPVVVLADPDRNYAEATLVSGSGDDLPGFLAGPLDKPIVVVEGFDPTNESFPSYFVGELASKYVDEAQTISALQLLASQGFDVFFYNFEDAGRSVREHAMGLLGALQAIAEADGGSAKAPTRVLGISMGGVVSRYALAWAEERGEEHGCDMFLSADAPQQGAWMSTNLQDFLKSVSQNFNSPSVQELVFRLTQKAALQLLSYNVFDEETPTSAELIDGTEQYEGLFRELNDLNGDGYPHRTVNIGLANARGTVAGRDAVQLFPARDPDCVGKQLASIQVMGLPVEVIPFQVSDLKPGSYSTVFREPSAIDQSIPVFGGLSILGFSIADPISLDFTITLGAIGPPAFIWAHSALDLRDVVWSGLFVVGGTSMFDEIHLVPPIDIDGVETENPFHDDFGPDVAGYALTRLMDGPQFAYPELLAPAGGEIWDGGTMQDITWVYHGQEPVSATLFLRPVGGAWTEITNSILSMTLVSPFQAGWSVPCEDGVFELMLETTLASGRVENVVSAPFTIRSDMDGDGWTVCEGDCNDFNSAVNPGVAENCATPYDDNCNGQINENCGGGGGGKGPHPQVTAGG